jgi:hypothetical protein
MLRNSRELPITAHLRPAVRRGMPASRFGPWAIALDTNIVTRLSTFWRKRMAMLNATRITVRDTSRRAILTVAITAGATLAMPTLYFSPPVAGAAAPDATRDEEGSARTLGRPVRVELAGGGVLELVAVGEHPSKDKPWWGPDGGLAEPPYQSFLSENQSEGIVREFVVRWAKRPEQGVTAHWSVEGDTSGCAGGLGYDADGKAIEGLESHAVSFRGEPKTCSVAIAVAAGPWKTLAETDGRNTRAEASPAGSFAFTKVIESKNALVLTVSHNILDDDVRLIALDHRGQTIAVGACEGGGAANFRQTTGTFANLALADVATFAVQSRPYQHYEIRDVSLLPGETTTPRVVKLDSPQTIAEKKAALLRQLDDLLNKRAKRAADDDARAEAQYRQRIQLLDKVDVPDSALP